MEKELKKLNEYMHRALVPVSERISLVTGILLSEFAQNCSLNTHTVEDALADIEETLTTQGMTKSGVLLAVKHFKTAFSRHQHQFDELYKLTVEACLPEKRDTKGFKDYTGEIFNILTEWTDVPDMAANDIILTPEYVRELMVDICEVKHEDIVYDPAAGTCSLFAGDFYGVEADYNMYLLGVLNLIMNEEDISRLQYGDGKRRIPSDVDVLLLNPPYSSDGKGLDFAYEIMSQMERGKAAVLIKESAGSGEGNPFACEILKRSTLRASIHMADIFIGKAQVQTAMYIFDVGKPHNEKDTVVFIDMSDDGYMRSRRKRGWNLLAVDEPRGRYVEVAEIVKGNKEGGFYKEGETVFRDTISLNGDDWTVGQHRTGIAIPTKDDFDRTITDYLLYQMREALQK